MVIVFNAINLVIRLHNVEAWRNWTLNVTIARNWVIKQVTVGIILWIKINIWLEWMGLIVIGYFMAIVIYAKVMVIKITSANLEYTWLIQCTGTSNVISPINLDNMLLSAKMWLLWRSLWRRMWSRLVNIIKWKSWYGERRSWIMQVNLVYKIGADTSSFDNWACCFGSRGVLKEIIWSLSLK